MAIDLVCRGFYDGSVSGRSRWLMIVTQGKIIEQYNEVMPNRYCNLICNPFHLNHDALHCAPLQRMVLMLI